MSAVALHHREDGDPAGAPVLLLGSLGTNLSMWEPQLPALSSRWVIRVDHRGHGESPAPPGPYTIADLGGDVVALLDALSLERVDVVGLSIGGMTAQWLAIHAPRRIGRLVLICTSSDTLNPDAFRERAATVRAAGTAEPVADGVVGAWFTPGFAEQRPEVVARHRAMIAATDPEGYASCCEAVAAHDVAAGLAGVSAPTLVIAGAQDGAIPSSQGERIAAAIPGAGFRLVSPAAHIATVEAQGTVNRLMREHLYG